MHENIVKMQMLCNAWWFKIIQTKTHAKNFAKTSKILKNHKKFQKPQKMGQNIWNAWLMSKKSSYQRRKIDLEAEDFLGMRFGVRKKGFGRWKDTNYQERSRRNERNVTRTLYIEIPVSRWIERCRDLSRIKMREIAIEQLLRICLEVSKAKGSRWIEKLSSIQKVPRWIE